MKKTAIAMLALAVACCAPKNNEVTGGTQPKDIIPMENLPKWNYLVKPA